MKCSLSSATTRILAAVRVQPLHGDNVCQNAVATSFHDPQHKPGDIILRRTRRLGFDFADDTASIGKFP